MLVHVLVIHDRLSGKLDARVFATQEQADAAKVAWATDKPNTRDLAVLARAVAYPIPTEYPHDRPPV